MKATLSVRVILSLLLVVLAVSTPPPVAVAASETGVWSQQNPKPPGNPLHSVAFVDARNGWAVGDGGTILHTSDGGATWNPQASGTDSDLNAVAFTDTDNGWAVGSLTILHTGDGGATWSAQALPNSDSFALNAVAFTDANHGWAVGDEGAFLRTTDGGSTWTQQDPREDGHYASAVTFTDASHGWVANGVTILRTTDGGATWNSQASGVGGGVMSVAFADVTHGWAVGDGGTILNTNDGGVTWTPQDSGTGNTLTSVAFTDASHGWAVGSGGTILNTNDGGVTWTPQDSGTGNALLSVAFTDASHGWAVGAGQYGAYSLSMLHTTDGGATWNSQVSGTTKNLSAVDFSDASHGWAVGDGGTVVRTTDSGATWNSQASGTTNDLFALDFTDASHGWAVGDGGVILRTGDGGGSWTPLTSGTTMPLYSVHFVDGNNGWAVGGQYQNTSVILHTTNGGTTWVPQTSGAQKRLRDVCFVDTNTGWAVGDGGVILHTTNGGTTWTTQISGTQYSIYSVAFTDANNGFVAGVYGIRGTRNGGTTWGARNSGTGSLSAVAFTDASHGWAVGGDYDTPAAIVRTEDGGNTWSPQSCGAATPANLSGVAFVDSTHGWAVGTDGTILAYTLVPDTTPPITTISGVSADWVNDDVDFDLTAADPGGSGVAGTWCRLTPPGSVSAATQGTVTDEGTTTIEYWSVDAAGNAEATKTATVRIDKTPPTTSSDATASYHGTATVRFTVTDTLSGPDTTRYVLDGGAVATGTLVSVAATGTHTLDFAGVDVAGNVDATHSVSFVVGAAQPPGDTYDAVFGAGRLDTAVEAARRAFPTSGSADTIVLATGYNWPDALGGASLAGAYGGPLLLTKPDVLSQQVLDEAKRLNVGRVVILGSTAAVSAAVESALKAAVVNGHKLVVTRVGGAGRYDTAARIASATVDVLASKGRTYDKTAFFATGGNFPDALAASPIAAAKGWPILLVRPDSLGTFTEGATAKLGVTRGIMLGSARAVSTAVETRLRTLLPNTPSRLSGATRYDTGIAIARFGVAGGLHWDGVAIATGTNFPDALAGGVMQGKLGSVVLLTPGTKLNPAVGAELTARKADIATVRYLGSVSALSQAVRNAVAAALR
jgi:photosystem II stability/assembly factor-like uncharacterized protein/putative cell wall-binding protein